MKKVCIVGGNYQYHTMFQQNGWVVVDRIEEADLAQFTGGEDVTPSMYGERKHPYTGNSRQRDDREHELFLKCTEQGKMMAGICRGGQFLNVMCGGKLFQHVDKHGIGGTHEAIDVSTGEVVQVTSTHHQMIRPGPDAVILAIAHLSTLREHMVDDIIMDVPRSAEDPDIESVYYPSRGVLCFQPHPEFGYVDCMKYYFTLLNRCFGM